MLTSILCLPGLTAAQIAWTDIVWFGFSMGTLFPIILALMGVVPYTVVVGICAVAHIGGHIGVRLAAGVLEGLPRLADNE